MAKRFGVLPSEFIKQHPDDFQFNLLIASVGADEESKALNKMKKSRPYGK